MIFPPIFIVQSVSRQICFDRLRYFSRQQEKKRRHLSITNYNMLPDRYKRRKTNRIEFYQNGKKDYNNRLHCLPKTDNFICKYDEKSTAALVLSSDFLTFPFFFPKFCCNFKT